MTDAFVSELRAIGEEIRGTSGSPIILDNEEDLYVLCEGEANVFCVSVNAHIFGRRRFVYQARAGDIFFGASQKSVGARAELIVTASSDTVFVRVKKIVFERMLQEGTFQESAKQALAGWLEWVSNVGHRLELKDLATQVLATLDLNQVAEFNRAALLRFDELYRYTDQQEEERYRIRQKLDEKNFSWSLSVIKTLIRSKRQVPQRVAKEDALVASCSLIGEYHGFAVQDPRTFALELEVEDPVSLIAECSDVRVRQVELAKDWWLKDGGPLLCFYEGSDVPVAVLPRSPTRYEIFDVTLGTIVPLTANEAAKLHKRAYLFFRPLPFEKLSLGRLLAWGLSHMGKDVGMLLATGLGIALVGVLTPVLAALLFDYIIPSASKLYLIYFVGALVISAIVSFLFTVAQGAAIARVAGRLNYLFQSAVVDRLLMLPASFFRRYPSGDLAYRAMGVDAIRSIFSDGVLMATISSLFAVLNLAVLFYFSAALASVMMVFVMVQIGYLAFIHYFQFRALRNEEQKSGEMIGAAYDMLGAIAKLRVAGAEVRSFSLWSRKLYEQLSESVSAQRYSNAIVVIGSMWDVFVLMGIFGTVVYLGVHTLTAGTFLAFNIALFGFGIAIGQMSQSVLLSLEVIPYLKGLSPIVETKPEATINKVSPGVLNGRIDVVHASFRYDNLNHPILTDINLSVKPGELVAIVGPSGAGKSTLLRLLLGFEEPTQGHIYFDGQDLATLNVPQIRRQIGVVMQNGRLFPGSILDNIIGASLLTVDDAWAAAKSCGLDADVRAMPMGMQTMIGEGGGGLSGGQRQRILIARALVRKPKMILFDEATSALDNDTQALVTESIAKMHVSRVVIAHRISTIQNADRIYVLQAGKIVQEGTFDALMQEEGIFADLAKRQIA